MQVKPKKCRNCGEKFFPNKSTQVCCSYTCALNLARKKVIEEGFKELKEKVTDWGDMLQKRVQEIARLIDYQQNCLAHNRPAKKIDGGHLKSRGGNSNMKYNLHNIFAQSAQSNHFQSEDFLMHEGIKREFGVEYLEFIESIKSTPVLKLTNNDYHEIYLVANSIAKRLKNDLKKHTNTDRIRMRNEINLELSIYPEEYCIYNKL